MKIAVVGLNWGRVHLSAYYQLGYQVVALVDHNLEHCRSLAEQYHIEHCFDSIAKLKGLDLDLISLAVPAKAHLQALRDAQELNCLILCEKPVLGYWATPEMYKNLPTNVFFNYAYPFLQDINLFYDRMHSMKNIKYLELNCRYNLPDIKSLNHAEMCYETVSHLIALAVHAMPPITDIRRVDDTKIVAVTGQGIEVRINCQKVDSFGGIEHEVIVQGDDQLEMRGAFYIGQNWHYQPIMFNGEKISQEFFPQEDPWYSANKRSIENILKFASGSQPLDETLKRGAFNLDKAMQVENILNVLKMR